MAARPGCHRGVPSAMSTAQTVATGSPQGKLDIIADGLDKDH